MRTRIVFVESTSKVELEKSLNSMNFYLHELLSSSVNGPDFDACVFETTVLGDEATREAKATVTSQSQALEASSQTVKVEPMMSGETTKTQTKVKKKGPYSLRKRKRVTYVDNPRPLRVSRRLRRSRQY